MPVAAMKPSEMRFARGETYKNACLHQSAVPRSRAQALVVADETKRRRKKKIAAAIPFSCQGFNLIRSDHGPRSTFQKALR